MTTSYMLELTKEEMRWLIAILRWLSKAKDSQLSTGILSKLQRLAEGK